MKKAIAVLLTSVLFAGICSAAVLNVPNQYSTIQAGIDTASNCDKNEQKLKEK